MPLLLPPLIGDVIEMLPWRFTCTSGAPDAASEETAGERDTACCRSPPPHTRRRHAVERIPRTISVLLLDLLPFPLHLIQRAFLGELARLGISPRLIVRWSRRRRVSVTSSLRLVALEKVSKSTESEQAVAIADTAKDRTYVVVGHGGLWDARDAAASDPKRGEIEHTEVLGIHPIKEHIYVLPIV